MLRSCCACANEAPANSAVTRTARRTLPVELSMVRYNHRHATKNERSMGSRGFAHIVSAPTHRVEDDGSGLVTTQWGERRPGLPTSTLSGAVPTAPPLRLSHSRSTLG